jgi:hypothetical protein
MKKLMGAALTAAMSLGAVQPTAASVNVSGVVCRAPSRYLNQSGFDGDGFANYSGVTITVECPLSLATSNADTAVVRVDGNNGSKELLTCTLYSNDSAGIRLGSASMTAEAGERFSTTIRLPGAGPATAYLTMQCKMPWPSTIYGFSVR